MDNIFGKFTIECANHEVIDGIDIFHHIVAPPYGHHYFIEIRYSGIKGCNFVWRLTKGRENPFQHRLLIEGGLTWKYLTLPLRNRIKAAVNEFLKAV